MRGNAHRCCACGDISNDKRICSNSCPFSDRDWPKNDGTYPNSYVITDYGPSLQIKLAVKVTRPQCDILEHDNIFADAGSTQNDATRMWQNKEDATELPKR